MSQTPETIAATNPLARDIDSRASATRAEVLHLLALQMDLTEEVKDADEPPTREEYLEGIADRCLRILTGRS